MTGARALAPTPFRTILVANRGEIALRIMRTAHRLGFRTVAVHSTADAGARHVREAGRAVLIGEGPPSRSYLSIDRILAAARASGADAVHPGYGFLAENAAFAQACQDAGLIFIGPSPEAIRAMGDKAGAKRIAAAAGVPCVPGYAGEDGSDATLLREAGRIGFPVMIKATAGGGGRGMRLVGDAQAFLDALRAARSEALGAFGDDTVILERAVASPRHIEIQVFGDRYGNAIHLGERDCSVQRRHQKLIEEAPSPAVGPELRARMGETAVAASKAIGYEGAGTLEFLLDAAGAFFFMEMNTRLQVEHPVTEAITGFDLVELQLRIAAGEALPLSQDEVRFAGHAIEVRLCAEDVRRNFAPRSGRMLDWAEPPGLRVETALEPGAEVPPYYDSMIAKVIATGATRDEARTLLSSGLRRMTALGLPTNQDFLARCLAHPVFAAGGATTAFIAENAGALLGEYGEMRPLDACLAALLLYLTADAAPVRLPARLAPSLPIPMRIELDGVVTPLTLTRLRDGRFQVELGEETHILGLCGLDQGRLRFEHDGVAESVSFVRDGKRVLLQRGSRAIEACDLSFAPTRTGEAAGTDGKLRASMNGRVAAVLVRAGEEVAAGQVVLTLEAMKMEHAHLAPVAGSVLSVVREGEQVAMNAVVADIAPASHPAA